MKNLYFYIKTAAVLLFLLIIVNKNIAANLYPNRVSVINNTDYPFVIVDKLAKLRIELPPHKSTFTTLWDINDAKFIINSFIVAKNEPINPTYALALFLQTDFYQGNWITTKADNYPENFPDPGSQIYCDSSHQYVCYFMYNSPAFIININSFN